MSEGRAASPTSGDEEELVAKSSMNFAAFSVGHETIFLLSHKTKIKRYFLLPNPTNIGTGDVDLACELISLQGDIIMREGFEKRGLVTQPY